VISRTLARRLNKLEERFRPRAEAMTILVRFIDSNGEVDGTLRVQMGGEDRSLRPLMRAGRRTWQDLALHGRF
jgi:hypothetical protein